MDEVTKKRPSILLAEDSDLLRDCLREILSEDYDFDVVGEAADGLEAVELARDLMPDLVLMDIELPQLDGFSATERIVDELPQVHVVCISMHDDDSVRRRCLRSGAKEFVLKDAPEEELAETLLRVAANGA